MSWFYQQWLEELERQRREARSPMEEIGAGISGGMKAALATIPGGKLVAGAMQHAAERPESAAGRVFDVARRGQYASANVASEAARRVREGDLRGVREHGEPGLLEMLVGTDVPMLRAAWSGLSGKDKKSYTDVILESEFGRDLAKSHAGAVGVILGGLAGDILLDPATYLTLGATKLGKGAAAAANIEDAAQLGRVAMTPDGLIDIAKSPAVVGKSMKMAEKMNAAVRAATQASGKSAGELANIYRAGASAQGAAGMRGVTFAGQTVLPLKAPYRFAERLPRWLAAVPDPNVIKTSKVYSAIEKKAPQVRTALSRAAEAFTPGDALLPELRNVNIQSMRTGMVKQARLGEDLPHTFAGLSDEARRFGDPDTYLDAFSQVVERSPQRAAAFLDDAAKRLEDLDQLVLASTGKRRGFYAAKAEALKRQMLAVSMADDVARNAGVPNDFVESYRRFLTANEVAQREATERLGLPWKPFSSTTLDYDMHIANRAWEAEVGRLPNSRVLLARARSASNPAQQFRKLRDYTRLEANMICTGKVPGMTAGDVFGKEFDGIIFQNAPFVTDPSVVARAKVSTTGRLVEFSEWIDGTRKMLVDTKNLDAAQVKALRAEGWRAPLAASKQWGETAEHFKDFLGEPYLVANIEHVLMTVADPQSMGDLARCWDAVTNQWRGLALLSPGYHVRNAFSNTYQNWLAGVKDPRVYRKAWQFQRAMRAVAQDGGQALKEFALDTPLGRLSGTQLREMLFSEDLLGGFMSEWSREIDAMQDAMMFSAGKATSAKRVVDKATKFNMAVGGVVENNARFALLFDRLGKGDNIIGAANTVRKFLFDYTPTGLSQFERGPVRRVTSFYRWQKNNLLLSVEQAIKQPGKFAAIPKVLDAAQAATSGGAPEEDYLQHFLAGGAAVRMPRPFWRGQNVPVYFSFKNWLPALEIAEFFSGLDEVPVPGFYWLMGMAHPAIQEVYQQFANVDLFTGRPIEQKIGEEVVSQKTRLMGIPMRPRLAHALRTAVPPTSNINKLLDKKGTLGEDLQAIATSRTYAYDRPQEEKLAGFRRRDLLSIYRRKRDAALDETPPDYGMARYYQSKIDAIPINP